VRFNWNWLNKNKRVFYYFSFTSHFTVWLWVKSSWLLFFAFFCFPSLSRLFISALFSSFSLQKTRCLYHTHTHINQSINQKCRDQRTIRSPSSPLFRSKRDLKFPRTSPSAFYFTSSQSSSISLLSKKTREIALLGIAVSPSLPLDSSAFQLWSRATAQNATLTRRTDRFSPFFYVQTACRRPWKPPSVVRIANASFVFCFFFFSFLFVFFEKVMSNWRENFLHITQQQRKKRITTDWCLTSFSYLTITPIITNRRREGNPVTERGQIDFTESHHVLRIPRQREGRRR